MTTLRERARAAFLETADAKALADAHLWEDRRRQATVALSQALNQNVEPLWLISEGYSNALEATVEDHRFLVAFWSDDKPEETTLGIFLQAEPDFFESLDELGKLFAQDDDRQAALLEDAVNGRR